MFSSDCIRPSHHSRLAVVYVRQSTPQQTRTNKESLQLQYELVHRAHNFGWSPERTRTLDEDLGCSGRSTVNRAAFQELVTLVSLDQAGIVFAYDVTRLARNCTDWYKLLDLCGLHGCLVADQDGVYDPATPNGRLILGLKGMIAELELTTLQHRLHAGLRHKAQRGDLAQRLPVGLLRDAQGRVGKHPDREVQSRLDLVFATFLQVRTLNGVVRFCNEQQLLVPRQDPQGDIIWHRADTANIRAILKNPAYAGAFVYGRTHTQAVAGKRLVKAASRTDWPICIRDKYPAYITWETYELIQTVLHDNYSDYLSHHGRDAVGSERRGVPRTGAALLPGIIYCGHCGHRLSVHYHATVRHKCAYLPQRYQVGAACLNLTAAALDQHVWEAFLEAVAPAELAALARALVAVEQEAAQVRHTHQLQLDRLRYEAHLAERRYRQVDPDNQNVAAELAHSWEVALRELKVAEEAAARDPQPAAGAAVDAATRQAVAEAGPTLRELWRQGRLTRPQQKALLRCLIAKVVVQTVTPGCVQVRIVWQGGDTSTASLAVAVHSWSRLGTMPALLDALRPLVQQEKSDAAIAALLTEQGQRSPLQLQVTPHMVRRLRLQHGLRRRGHQSQPRRIAGYLTVGQLAGVLQVAPHWGVQSNGLEGVAIHAGCMSALSCNL